MMPIMLMKTSYKMKLKMRLCWIRTLNRRMEMICSSLVNKSGKVVSLSQMKPSRWQKSYFPKDIKFSSHLNSSIPQSKLKCSWISSIMCCTGWVWRNSSYFAWCFFSSCVRQVRCGFSCLMCPTYWEASSAFKFRRKFQNLTISSIWCSQTLTKSPSYRWVLHSMKSGCKLRS